MACLRTILILATFVAAPGVGTAADVSLNGQVFTLPNDFEIDLVAKTPIVERPITAAFDEQGRFYVADSSGSNEPVEKQLVDRPHRILRLEDSDSDGRFDRRTVFADKMMFPEGTMWLDGSLYVAAAPTIWKLTDTNGDGVADRREEWLTRTLTHCGNDLHGPYAGPDGWIYWCKGAFARQSYQLPGKKPTISSAAHIFRARPDGTGLEPVMTGGMENPIDVVFTPGGERIFSATFLSRPQDGQRDGLIHAIYGGVYGKPHRALEGHKRTGELLPPLVHLGPAAPSGVTRYESQVFGPEYQDNLFTCCFNMRKVTRHVLTPKGATFQATTEDFLVSNNLDFHPTDVVEDADGSLIVIDTGGWYKICCPSSQLWKPDILGAIYRIRRKRAPKMVDPRGLMLAWRDGSSDALADRLADRRPAVRKRALQELAERGPHALPALERALKSPSVDARRNAVWALTRIDRPSARAAVRPALSDRDATVRQAAINSVSAWRDGAAAPLLIELLRSGSPHNQRAAAEALGRIGDRSAVPSLLRAAGRLVSRSLRNGQGLEHDRILEHSLIFALIEIDDPSAMRAALADENSWTRRAALIAVDQMDGGALRPAQVAALLNAPNLDLKDAASWIIDHHADWAGPLAGSLRDRLYARGRSEADDAELERHLAQFAANRSVQELLATALADQSLSAANRRTVLHAMRDSGLREMPPSWVGVLVWALGESDPLLAADAVATIRTLAVSGLRGAEFEPALIRLANSRAMPDGARLEALAAVPGGLRHVSPEMFEYLQAHLDTDLPPAIRGAAAEVLSNAHLSGTQLARVTESLKSAGPMEADRLLAAFENCADATIGMKLIAALRTSPVLTSFRVDRIRQRIKKQPISVQAQAETLYRLINVDIAKQRERIEQILPMVAHGDVRRGQLVFTHSKVACMACHQFGSVGGHIGPDLTKIGAIRSERDLLEAIMFPSASFVQSFEPIQVVTRSGKVYNGLLRKDAPDEIVLVASATETVRIPRDEIEELHPSTVSIMPAGVDKQLTPQELADLVAFLKHAKSKNVQ